jgi:hypothetical protein
MDPIAAKITKTLVSKVIAPAVGNYLKKLPRTNDERFEIARREMFEDWLLEVRDRTQEQFEDLARWCPDIDERLEALERDRAAHRVHVNYARAADAEPIDERRRMLAFADAALIDSRLTVPEHSRVERLIRELDPDDVLWLSALDRIAGRRRGETVHWDEGNLRWTLWSESSSADVLVASGCVRIQHHSGGLGHAGHDAALVTRQGSQVLHALRLYVALRPAPAKIPGREAHPEDRSEDEARKTLARAFSPADVLRIGSTRRARYDFPHRGDGAGAPLPPHNAKAILRIAKVPRGEAGHLADHFPGSERTPKDTCTPVEEIFAEVRDEGDGPDVCTVTIHGPHDVLRWLADDIGARWT